MANLSPTQWTGLLDRLRADHNDLYRPWFDQLEPRQLAYGELEVRAARQDQRDYLATYCQAAFRDAAQIATGRLVTVRFIAPPANQTDPADMAIELESLPLNKDYEFEHFVTGPCNRLAHAASVAASETPGEAYNPLFLHGQTGLGKTHLLQAICHVVRRSSPERQILYLTCETFINHFIDAIEHGRANGFRYRYRHVDLLVIDDIQFLAEHERSQEEFFHTFNTLHQLRKQIVVSADCQPEEIPSLEDRLVSRFKWGLVARLDVPCFETRQAIIRKKARLRCIDLPEDVVSHIARQANGNIRELEGILTRVQAAATFHHGRIDLELVKQALQEDGEVIRREVAVQDILEVVTEHFTVRATDLLGKHRHKSLVLPRQVCMYLARQLTRLSLSEIGGYFGGRDHTTVLHAQKAVSAVCQSDAAFRQQVEQIADRLRQRRAP